MKKILILSIFSMLIFTRCNSPNYKYEVTHIDNSKEIITVQDSNPLLEEDKLTSQCGCSTYATNVKTFKQVLYIDPAKNAQSKSKLENKSWFELFGMKFKKE